MIISDEYLSVIFSCDTCKGKGFILNPNFERCAKENISPEEIKCSINHCEWYLDCQVGEIIECPDCKGSGTLLLSQKEFKRRLNMHINQHVEDQKRKILNEIQWAIYNIDERTAEEIIMVYGMIYLYRLLNSNSFHEHLTDFWALYNKFIQGKIDLPRLEEEQAKLLIQKMKVVVR
ncbi:hypothetical protein [Thermococcus sp.]